MSLRDFNNAPFPDDPRALHTAPSGNGTGLENFHTVQPEDIEPNNTPKIVGGIAVALMIGVAGIALYTSGGSHSKAMVASNTPAPVTQPVTPPPAPAAATPDASMPASDKTADATPAAKEPVKEASIAKTHHKMASADSSVAIKSADAKSASDTSSSAAAQRMAADTNQSTVQPQQQEITAPAAPSPTNLASNQSGTPNAAPASDAPAQAQPAEQAQPATPAAPAPVQPAGADQSAGQVNQ